MISMSLSVYLSVCRMHILGNTRPSFSKFSVPVAVAWSFSGGVAIRYVLLVLCITSCFPVWTLRQRDVTAATSPQCRARTNTPAAWYRLRSVLHDGRRALRLDESFVRGEVCDLPLPCFEKMAGSPV